MSEYSVWWIDDNPDREEDAERVGRFESELKIQFTGPNKALECLDPDQEKPKILADIDLVLIDWKLNEKEDFVGKGLTMAGKVREELAGVPIYGFSSDIDSLRKAGGDDQFEATLEDREIISKAGANSLKQDLDAYAAIERARGGGYEKLIEVLEPPEESFDELQSVVPREYMNGLKSDRTANGGSGIEFAEWVRNRFLETPGPLLNDSWMATKIGLETEALDDYSEELNGTQHGEITYSGIFAHRAERLWWFSLLIDVVVALAQDRDVQAGELKTVGKAVLGETDRISRCEVCQKELPDIVAAGRNGEDASAPVHFGCSHIHHTREGAFEDYRIADNL